MIIRISSSLNKEIENKVCFTKWEDHNPKLDTTKRSDLKAKRILPRGKLVAMTLNNVSPDENQFVHKAFARPKQEEYQIQDLS